MGKRRAGSQTGKLIARLKTQHKKSGIDLFPTSDLSVRHGVGNISTRATTLVQTSLRSNSALGSYGGSKFRESRQDNFETPFRESREFVPFGCSLRDQPQKMLYGGRWCLPLSPGRGESCVSKCPWQVPTPEGVPNAKLTRFGWFLDADSHELI
jgi:hypothetical protein